MLVNSALQLNPTIYKDPLAFNPWRWKVYDSSFSQLLHTFFFLILLMFFMAISLTAFFFLTEPCRILTHWLYLRIPCLLEEELDNVQGQNIAKRSWLPSSMFWSPNICNLLPFVVLFVLLPQQDDHIHFCGGILHIRGLLSFILFYLFFSFLGEQRSREETMCEV
jgi:hypothetical protein